MIKIKLIVIGIISVFSLQVLNSDASAKLDRQAAESPEDVYVHCREGDPDECYNNCGNKAPTCTVCVDIRTNAKTHHCSKRRYQNSNLNSEISKLPGYCKLQPPRSCRRVCNFDEGEFTIAPCATCTPAGQSSPTLLCGSQKINAYAKQQNSA